MDPENGTRSRRVSPPGYQLPPSASAGEPIRCTRCGRYFYAHAIVHDAQGRGPVCHECQQRPSSPRFPSRQQPGTLVATEFIPAWHRSATAPADVMTQPTPDAPHPLHHYQQWNGYTAPAPGRPNDSMVPMRQPRGALSLPQPPPPPSSYLMSQLPQLMARLEEEALLPTSQDANQQPGAQSVDPNASPAQALGRPPDCKVFEPALSPLGLLDYNGFPK
ncbi:hypothetical protein FKP32DRAFT_1681171 [Trametes sanguinea]|nr:hypothetical protein FKP32DRAFT_1681171 [Trametes sanguinea]